MSGLCGARNRAGSFCRRYRLRGRPRCHMHGGRLVGGMRWPDPRLAIAVANVGHARWLRFRRAMGLVHPGGRPRKIGTVLRMVEKAKADLATAIVGFEEALPAERADGLMTPTEGLSRAALIGLERLQEIISVPVTPEMVLGQTKAVRLIGDMALGANKLFLQAARGAFDARRTDAIEKLLEEIAEERKSVKSS